MHQVHKLDTGIVELLLVKIPKDLKSSMKNEFGISGISEIEGRGDHKYIANIIIENISEYIIIGKLCDITNERIELIVSKNNNFNQDKKTGNKRITWKNYCGEDILKTAWQSFNSCLLVHGLFTIEPKKPKFSLSELSNITVDTDTPVQEYKKNIQRYINPKTTLVLIKRKR